MFVKNSYVGQVQKTVSTKFTQEIKEIVKSWVLNELTRLMKKSWMEPVLTKLTRLPKEDYRSVVLIEFSRLTQEDCFKFNIHRVGLAKEEFLMYD